ncbi:MAG: hypothetical protein JKY48_18925 [Flavobacteriales bacterium]|nr:hypothetical protein [Flavobacteriales bacterium]
MLSSSSSALFLLLFESLLLPLLLLCSLQFSPLSWRLSLSWTLLASISSFSAISLLLFAATSSSLFFLLSMLGKMSAYPLHSWLLEVHSQASSSGSILLSALYVKVGLLGFILSLSSSLSAPLFLLSTLFALGLCLSALQLFHETDFKRLIALSTTLHANQLCLPLSLPSLDILSCSLIFTLQHSLSSSLLFSLASLHTIRSGSKSLLLLHLSSPTLFLAFLLSFLLAANFPLSFGFIGEASLLSSLTSSSLSFAMLFLIAATLKAFALISLLSRSIFSGSASSSLGSSLGLLSPLLLSLVTLALLPFFLLSLSPSLNTPYSSYLFLATFASLTFISSRFTLTCFSLCLCTVCCLWFSLHWFLCSLLSPYFHLHPLSSLACCCITHIFSICCWSSPHYVPLPCFFPLSGCLL